jgi:hypothetical protein
MIKARREVFGPEVDGIDGASVEWHGRAYNNPPYGREIPRFTDRARLEHESGRASGIIQLLPFRAAGWFLDTILAAATAMVPIRGRLVFLGSLDSYPVDSMAVLWGREYKATFREAFCEYVPRSPVCRAEPIKAMKKAGRVRRRVRWVPLSRPLGRFVDLEKARR